MGQKRLTRAQTQHELGRELDQLRVNDAYGDKVLAEVRAGLGSSVHPQQERAILENNEKLNEYYKELSETFTTKAAQEAEEGLAVQDDITAAERAIFLMRDEVEMLKLKKVDPELDDRLQQMAEKIKEKLLEYPTLLGAVTGDEKFMEGVKKSYESKIEEFETKLGMAINDVFELPFDWSSKFETLLATFAETTIEPAISIVKVQHARLETEVGEANEENEQLKEQIGDMKADAQRAKGEIEELTLQHHTKEQSLTDDIAALKEKLEANEEADRSRRETHQREKTSLLAQVEKARTNAAAEAKIYEEEIESYRASAEELEKGKKDLEERLQKWQDRFNVRRQENDRLKADNKSNEAKLKSAEEQVYSLEENLENLRTEKDALTVAKEKAGQEIRSLRKEVKDWEARGDMMITKHGSLKDEFAALKASTDKKILSLQGQLSTEQTEKASLQQSHEGEIQKVKSQLATAMTDIASLNNSIAQQAQDFQGEISTTKTEKKSLQRSHEGEIQKVKSQLATAKTDMDSFKRSTARETQELRDELSRAEAEMAEREYNGKEWEKKAQSLKDQLSTEKESLERADNELSSVKSDGELLKQSLEAEIGSLQSQLSMAKSEKVSLMQTREKESLSFQTQLSSSKSEIESLRRSMGKEVQSLRDQLSKANDANNSLVRSKQELGAEYCGATESAESKSRLLVSILDEHNFEGAKSEEVLSEMEKLFGMMERYTGSMTEMVSMPQMPGMTIIGKAAELAEPNLAAARRLWISSRCGSLALDVAQAFFMQREIPLAQFALLPWIYASLNHAVTTMCEKSTLTPDLAITSVWILRGLVYTATVAREWSEGVWKIEEMLAQMTHWLGEHVSREASLLMKIVDQFNESQSASISPKDVEESQRIDSGNSEIPDGMALVVDISGILILFTADNAFIFGANEVKVLESSSDKTLVMKFDQAVTGLPATLMELQLGLNAPAEVTNRHEALLKSVLTQDRIKFIYTSKRRRMR